MDRYRIEGKIGEGAHGVVLKAKKISTGDTVCHVSDVNARLCFEVTSVSHSCIQHQQTHDTDAIVCGWVGMVLQVALKKVMIRRLEDGIPTNALREIKALQEIDVHDNIVTLR